MSIQSSNRVAGPYLGNNSTTLFPFSFKVFSTDEVRVVLTDADDADSDLEFGTDYTVSLNSDQDANPGGTITVAAAPTGDEKLTITSKLANLQPETLTNQGGFYPKVIEYALDRLTILVQQVDEKANRSLQVPISGGTSSSELLEQLTEQLPLVQAVHGHLDSIDAVASNQDNVDTVADGIGSVNTVAGDMSGTWETGVAYDFGNVADPPVGNTSPPGGNIVTVAGSIAQVAAVAANIDDVGTVSTHLSSLLAVANGIDDVQAVASDLENIDAVADNAANVNAVAGATGNINTVSANIIDVNAVANALADVQAVAGIAADVATVADNEAAIVALGNDLTGQPLVLDYGDLSPASNPAAPTGALGAIYANGANIAAVAANIAAVVQVANDLAAILAALSGALVPANNLSDLTNAATARANLGLADLGGLT